LLTCFLLDLFVYDYFVTSYASLPPEMIRRELGETSLNDWSIMVNFGVNFIGYLFGAKAPHVEMPALTADDLAQMPGSWPKTDVTLDEMMLDTVQFLPYLISHSVRAGVILSFFLLIWLLFWVLSGIAWSIPIIMSVIIFKCFGVVFTVTLTVKVLLWLCAAVSSALALGPLLWCFVISFAMSFAKSTPLGNEKVKSLVTRLLGVVSDQNLKFSIQFGGITFTEKNVVALASQDEPAVIAVITYFLYCPSFLPGLGGLVSVAFMLTMMYSRVLYAAVRLQTRAFFFTFRVSLCVIFLGLVASDKVIMLGSDLMVFVWTLAFYPFYWLVWRRNFKTARTLFKLAILRMLLKLINWGLVLHFISLNAKSDVKGLNLKKKTLRSYWNNMILDLNKTVDKIAVPEFIRSLPDRFDRDAINETQEILSELGWPTAPVVSANKPTAPQNITSYIDHVIGTTSIKQGVTHLDLQVAKELWRLRDNTKDWKRTEQYATEENELESLARYFEALPVEGLDVSINEVMVLVGDIFRNSKLTPFHHILRKWEKKYGLGPFWGEITKNGKWRKLKRSAFIKSIGGIPAMLQLWAKTFKVAPGLVPVAGVSVKGEALPPKKWENDLVRTVISAPIVHYISSTLWNYFPNHNFKFWSTNIKVGMPLNGANISKLIAEHDAYDNHFAGDFTAFDSTVGASVAKIIAGVRKKGFSRHRDYAKICFLIDANYEALLKMPMMTTSTGNIYSKKGGLSTGHSSTSTDNSLAVTIYYLAAWKAITGLSAHEFRHYCKLSNYGDDHLLSWHKAAPPTWNSANIIKTMSRFGVGIRDEEPSHVLSRMTFLAKGWRRPTGADIAAFILAGVAVPGWVVFHDVNKLVKKAYAPSKDAKVDRDYRIKRLVSYLYLCAHHPDVYEKIVASIEEVRITNKGKVMRLAVHVPSYNEVLAKWYNPESVISEEDVEDPGEQILDYSMDGIADTVVNILSVIPDFLNPAIYNMGYTNHLISLFRRQLSWPVHLIKIANSAFGPAEVVALIRKTPYDFLADSAAIMSSPREHSSGGLLLRHWLFCLLCNHSESTYLGNVLTHVDKKIASFNFILNGHVQTIVRRFDIPWWRVLIISLLFFIPDFTVPDWVLWIRVPSLSEVIEGATGYLLNVMWTKVPVNMKQSLHAIESIGNSICSVLVQAATGTGKSTSLVATIYRTVWSRYDRIIMVVPRSLLVVTLAPYLQSAFGLPAHPVTEGFVYDPNQRFIICTAMEVFLHGEWLSKSNLFIWDECHVMEPHYLALRHILFSMQMNVVMTTATPTAQNYDDADITCPLTIARTWEITETLSETIDASSMTEQLYWQDYRSRIIRIVKGFPGAKFLIFVVDKSQADYLSVRFEARSCILSSESKVIDPQAKIFIATSVADVGLTIPNIDWVITSDITRSSGPLLPMAGERNGIEKVGLHKLSPATIVQRFGRTGRTSNGLATKFSYTNASFVTQMNEWSLRTIGASILRNGAPVSLVATYFPEALESLWSDSLPGEFEEKRADFVARYEVFQQALKSVNQRSYKPALDAASRAEFYTIAGNTLPSSRQSVEEGEYHRQMQPTPATTDDVHRFVVGASKWLVDRNARLSEEQIIAFLRSRHLSWREFMQSFSATGEWREDIFSMMGVHDTIETGRFGKRIAPMPHLVEDEPMRDAAYFDNPKPKDVLAPRVATGATERLAPRRKPMTDEARAKLSSLMSGTGLVSASDPDMDLPPHRRRSAQVGPQAPRSLEELLNSGWGNSPGPSKQPDEED